MKRAPIVRKIIFILFIAGCITNTSTTFSQVNVQDSLALVDLYNSTDGSNWLHQWNLSLQADYWYGVQVIDHRVISVQLSNNRLKGNIPSSIGNLSALQILDFDSNNELTGDIPTTLGNLSNLQNLRLNDNQLTGHIPSSLGNLKKLEQLIFYQNQLSGNIPSSMGNMESLQYLNLEKNQLSGNIPSSLGNLKNLLSFSVGTNQLSGNIPPSLGKLSSLKVLLLSFNQLTGNIPSSLGNLSNLQWLIANSNKLSGSIPSSLGNLSNLTDIALRGNELSGSVPVSWGDIKTLSGLNLDSNRLTFDGIEEIASKATIKFFYYSPQANIPLNYRSGKLSVSAGGTLANNTYHWYKDAVLYKENTGDSMLPVTEAGKYSVAVTNAIATDLTLYSDTLDIKTLPINLLSFTAQKQNNSVLLQWQTADEINNSYFDVERSSDPKTFFSIGTKQGLNSAGTNNYSFTDNAPLKGINYYRLKQVDKDGKFSYSGIASVEFLNNGSVFAISPNPANNLINVVIPSSNSVSEIIIYDISGKKILHEEVATNITSKQINISQLNAGVYNVILIQNDKKKMMKLVKK